MKSSNSLHVGTVYTRQHLREKFKINDATINTGIFRPRDHKSIWLFITQKKSSSMTQYNDRLEGDDLHMDGQSEGRTDQMLIEHQKNGDEVLLFFRRTKTEHPEGGFRYEGRFLHVSHTGTKPAHFHFQRVKD
jgi:putative restriction endonuclease